MGGESWAPSAGRGYILRCIVAAGLPPNGVRTPPMSLRIHNTLTRALEDFSPIEPGHVRMYVCGITVYDLCHVGHARANVAFDAVGRWLQASGYRVTFVRN